MRRLGLGPVLLFLTTPATAAEHWLCHHSRDWIDYVAEGKALVEYHNDVIIQFRITANNKRRIVAALDNGTNFVVEIDKRTGEFSSGFNNSREPDGICRLTDGPIQQYGPPSH